jgi:hypothetical protein
MLRSVAVTRIIDGLGFRVGLDSKIILRLQEAQRNLEAGKTLPAFLRQSDQTFQILTGAHTFALPSGFIRIDDENLPHFTTTESDTPIFLQPKRYQQAVEGNIRTEDDPRAPTVFVIRNSTLDVITTVDKDYTFTWSYYKRADVLTSDIENAWLADDQGGADWLIGEAGWRMAMDIRDNNAVQIFDTLRQSGRAALFGEILASETESGPMVMGENN